MVYTLIAIHHLIPTQSTDPLTPTHPIPSLTPHPQAFDINLLSPIYRPTLSLTPPHLQAFDKEMQQVRMFRQTDIAFVSQLVTYTIPFHCKVGDVLKR